jgi:MFS family permease
MGISRSSAVRRHRALIALPLVATAFAIVMTLGAMATDRLSEIVWVVTGGMVAFTTVGALIEDRRPGQSVGRVCLSIGVLLLASGILLFAAASLDSLPGHVPALGAALAVISSGILGSIVFGGGLILISRFPDGRQQGRLADVVDVLVAIAVATFATGTFRPGLIEFGWIEAVPNPLGLSAILFLSIDTALTIATVAYATGLTLACIGLVLRYIRGTSVTRAQIRWFAGAIGVTIGFFVLLLVTSEQPALNGWIWSAWMLSLILPPLAIAVAILRDHLYDIDRIVGNAIGYGLVTVVLFGVFAAVNLTLVSSVSPFVNDEGIAVAASTLLVAALFNPVRVRVQRAVDRRFHRARYDAERMVADFAGRLRGEMEISRLRQDVLEVVDRSVSPTRVDLWLRRGRAQ